MMCSVFESPSNRANRRIKQIAGRAWFVRFLPTIAGNSRSSGQDPLGQLVVRFLIVQEMPGLFWTGKRKKARLTNVDHADLGRQRTASFHVFVLEGAQSLSRRELFLQSTMKCLRFLGRADGGFGKRAPHATMRAYPQPTSRNCYVWRGSSPAAVHRRPKIAGDAVGIHFTRSLECRGYRQRVQDNLVSGSSSATLVAATIRDSQALVQGAAQESSPFQMGATVVEHGEGCDRI
jgi:hypothetical protein